MLHFTVCPWANGNCKYFELNIWEENDNKTAGYQLLEKFQEKLDIEEKSDTLRWKQLNGEDTHCEKLHLSQNRTQSWENLSGESDWNFL